MTYPRTKRIWLITTLTQNNVTNEHVCVATCEKDCREVINELMFEEVFDYNSFQVIGNVSSKDAFYKKWQGESFVITTNYYNN